jgi:tripeptide aminopeptidase
MRVSIPRSGGKAAGDVTNVVTDYAPIKGEARSPDLAFAHAITEAFRKAFDKARLEIQDAGGETPRSPSAPK